MRLTIHLLTGMAALAAMLFTTCAIGVFLVIVLGFKLPSESWWSFAVLAFLSLLVCSKIETSITAVRDWVLAKYDKYHETRWQRRQRGL